MTDTPTDLRRKAEEKTACLAEINAPLSPEATLQTLHELRVLQIELEMQNEELRQSQAERDASRMRYFDLYNQAPVSYFTLSQAGIIVEANLKASKLLNVPQSTLVKQPISRFILKADQDIYYLHRKRLFETTEPQACDLRMVKSDGTEFWAHLKATTTDAGGVPACRVILSDISERKQEEIRRRESETLLRQLNETLEMRVLDRTQELKTANASLAQKVSQLRKLAIDLTRAEERERKHLALQLHDHLQPFLAAAAMKVSLFSPSESAEALTQRVTQSLDLIQSAIGVSRSLTTDLYPPILLDAGFMPGLHWLADWIKKHHGLSVEITGNKTLEIPEPIGILLFQGIRELLLNVVKHAQSDIAMVNLDQKGDHTIEIIVTDQGVGFSEKHNDAPRSSGGLGLFHLRERLTFIGGKLEFQSNDGRGTKAFISIPVMKEPLPSGLDRDLDLKPQNHYSIT